MCVINVKISRKHRRRWRRIGELFNQRGLLTRVIIIGILPNARDYLFHSRMCSKLLRNIVLSLCF